MVWRALDVVGGLSTGSSVGRRSHAGRSRAAGIAGNGHSLIAIKPFAGWSCDQFRGVPHRTKINHWCRRSDGVVCASCRQVGDGS